MTYTKPSIAAVLQLEGELGGRAFSRQIIVDSEDLNYPVDRSSGAPVPLVRVGATGRVRPS
jgi:hypothetical protein